ncbi:hypothetical protein BJ878DRAFT_540277 [Calycina marina]|uniref:Zn(2)-C6 fungal-type domain-containing protein n=1 Tax=Calycina marina TaxID=1763456 RepID=A0A9P7Z6R4_9HELO|nr:hypothetical protein BJ878DRAFT_540277 [Calycina marina]
MAERPQVEIERLPQRRMSNEPRESMNCKLCRKRKIKCNHAVPKKRGPKTDSVKALLKRVHGLEKKLREEKKTSTPPNEGGKVGSDASGETKPNPFHLETNEIANETAI